jgi:hypothetical protein
MLSIVTTYGPSLVRLSTSTETGLVPTGHVNKPFLGLGGWLQDRLPVVKGQRGDDLLGDLACSLLSDVLHGNRGRWRTWNKRLDFVEPASDLVAQGDLVLSSSERGQRSDQGDDAHFRKKKRNQREAKKKKSNNNTATRKRLFLREL